MNTSIKEKLLCEIYRRLLRPIKIKSRLTDRTMVMVMDSHLDSAQFAFLVKIWF